MSQCQCQHPSPAGRRRKAVQGQLSVNVYQLLSTQCQVGCLFQLQVTKVRPDKSPTKVRVALIHQEKWLLCCLWHRSRIRAHNKLCEAVKLLGLSQYIFLFTMHQSSSSKSHYKAEIDENPVWPEFWTSQVFRLFFVIAYMKQQTLCCKLLWNRKERQKKKTQASS